MDLDKVKETIITDEEFSFDNSDEILNFLNEEDRYIFKKLFIEGYSYDDLEQITKIPKDRLYNRVSRSKKKLKVQLGGKYD